MHLCLYDEKQGRQTTNEPDKNLMFKSSASVQYKLKKKI